MPLARGFSEPGIVGWGLRTAAELGLRTGRPDDGAALLAARNAIVEEHGLPSLASEDTENRRLREAFQAALEPEKDQAAQDRGAAMSIVAATELACSVANPIRLSEPAGEDSHIAPGLSHRERELVTLVARGFTDAQIAERLFISIRTVRSHLDRIRDKTGCRRRADLTRLALADQLV
jgi:DNA-binding CsgD family transcriptional regulator